MEASMLSSPSMEQKDAVIAKALGEAETLSSHGHRLMSAGAFDKALPVLQAALGMSLIALGPEHRDTAAAANVLGIVHQRMGQFGEASKLFEKALAAYMAALGPEHPSTASALGNLGTLYSSMERYDEALPLLQQALDATRNALGAGHPETATLLHNLGVLQGATGHCDEGLQLVKEALQIRREALGPEHPTCANSLNILAKLDVGLGHYASALPFAQEAVDLNMKVLGPNHPQTTSSVTNLSNVLDKLGRHEDAVPLLEKALQVSRMTSGEAHPDTIAYTGNLAKMYGKAGQNEEALQLLNHALDVTRKSFGADHPRTASPLTNIADLLLSMSRYNEALPLFEQALEVRRKVLGLAHPDSITSLTNVARCHGHLGHRSRALQLFEQALELSNRELGPKHQISTECLHDLATFYANIGQYSQAVHLNEQLVASMRITTVPDNSNLAGAINNLAALYSNLGRFEEALPLSREALELMQKASGVEHPNTVWPLRTLANIYEEMGRYDEALPLFSRAVDVTMKALGPDHPDTLSSLQYQGLILKKMRRLDEALVLYESSLDTMKRVLGANHATTAAAVHNLAGLYKLVGRSTEAVPLYEQALEVTLATQGPDHPHTAKCHFNLARQYFDSGLHDEALRMVEESLRIQRKVYGALHMEVAETLSARMSIYIDSEQFLEAFTDAMEVGGIEVALLMRMMPFLGPRSRLLWLQLLPRAFGPSLAVACLLSVQGQAPEEGMHQLAEWVLQRKDVTMASQRLLRRLLAAGGEETLVHELRQLRHLQALGQAEATHLQRVDEVEELLQQRHPQLKEALSRRYLSSVQAELQRHDAVLLEYVVEEDFVFIVCIPGQGAPSYDAALARYTDLRRLVRLEALRVAGLAPGSTRSKGYEIEEEDECEESRLEDRDEESAAAQGSATLEEQLSKRLYQALVAPVENFLAGASHIFVAAAGALHQVAFEALLTPGGDLWLDALTRKNCSLSYLNVGRQLADFQPGEAGETGSLHPPVVIGAPQFDYFGAAEEKQEVVPEAKGSAALPGEAADHGAAVVRKGLHEAQLRNGGAGAFADLFWAREEAKEVAGLLGVEAAVGVRATRQRLLAVRRPRILHVATHGWCAPPPDEGVGDDEKTGQDVPQQPQEQEGLELKATKKEPMEAPQLATLMQAKDSAGKWDAGHPLLRSALLLAGTNAILAGCPHGTGTGGGGELPHCAACGRSGLVTALEVAELDLTGTELAVLSACSSGFGVAARHEGHLGLRSALHQAGVRAAVVSLWDVPDGWTKLLMVAFYDYLLQGLGRLEALRVAQFDARQAGAPLAAWAAFILVGDPSPLA